MNDETKIKQAVNTLLSDYPKFNADGLCCVRKADQWQNPIYSESFMAAAKNCLTWIRENGLENSQAKAFCMGNPTSYGIKHEIEKRWKAGKIYIPNGALIAAMVACGYEVMAAYDRINCLFDVLPSDLREALKK